MGTSSTVSRRAACQLIGVALREEEERKKTKLGPSRSKNVPLGRAAAREGGQRGKTWRCVLLLKVWRSRISLPAQRRSQPGPQSETHQ